MAESTFDDRRSILNMLAEGKITADEAERLMSAVDWADFFESVSLVEEALREGTRVAEMDFPTRDRYRRAIEELALHLVIGAEHLTATRAELSYANFRDWRARSRSTRSSSTRC